MNRFRTKRRAKDDASAPDQSSLPSFKSFRRGKKSTEQETKKEFDLTSALPSDDNFRTSLLMTNLSARFSMLREQDDPNTKIGKASDDSVLFPKRQSRLADFGFTAGSGGLSDIAEVESIKAPFLRGEVNSYISEDADSTKGGGIMNRGKPTEGNILFGGRQKIYKIPLGSSSSAKGNAAGGMAGRALYEDDVALSAFQLWRQTEKRRKSIGSENNQPTTDGLEGEEADPSRSESPLPVGYNRKRETSSTTSSASAVARYSTAATSITSQPTTSARESQTTSTAASSNTSTPTIERSVTRTRRLYEQALTQDMHDQQSSALSRIDTLSRQRPMRARTPDLAQISPSPTNLAFHERFGERRPILTKASAPNLRSLSPPANASSSSTLDLVTKAPAQPDSRNVFGGLPPLSPPISETGDHVLLPIQPNDRGKATAMGVFQKPVESYDESKYAQRQLQLQLGREVPRSRVRAESNASFATSGRSRSSSSMQRQPLEIKAEPSRRIEPTVKEEHGYGGTFLDDSDDSAAVKPDKHSTTPQVVLQRPADKDHPAFRQSALSTPLSLSDMTVVNLPEALERPDTAVTTSRHASPPDSPTLGPTSGLSGMVRHHLRSESNSSSLYGVVPQTAGLDTRFPVDPRDSMIEGPGFKSNPWATHEQDWNTSDSNGQGMRMTGYAPNGSIRESDSKRHSSGQLSNDETESGTDEFANQLADARRRVRERLTSYAETDSSREGSPLRNADPRKDTTGQQPSQINALGIGTLGAKSSRGSLIDRSHTKAGTQSKAMKMLGIGAATMTTSPSPSKQTFDEKERPLAAMQEDSAVQGQKADFQGTNVLAESENDTKSLKEKDDEHVHPGLRAFRQARRELQRRKELETLARHQASQITSSAAEGADRLNHETSTPVTERSARQRTPSRERKPPPVFYQQQTQRDDPGYGQAPSSHPGSRQTSTERNRSGSEASNSRSGSRPARLRNNSPLDAQHQYDQLGSATASRSPMLRSPGLPGTDIRRSPIMPPQGYPGSGTTSPMPPASYLDRSHSATNLTVQPTVSGHGLHSGHPSSPSSPLGDPMGQSAPSGIQAGRPPAPHSPAFNTTTSTMNDSLKRTVNKHDISEPTFIMSTSRVPTVNLATSGDGSGGPNPQASMRSRSGTAASHSAPPLPPINPLRRREVSGTKDGVEQLHDGTGDGQDHTPPRLNTSQLSIVSSTQSSNGPESIGRRRGASSLDDDPDRNRVLRSTSGNDDAQGPGYGTHLLRQKGTSHFIATSPPASRTVLTPHLKPSNTAVPGGMF